jgi:hypothetical protein
MYDSAGRFLATTYWLATIMTRSTRDCAKLLKMIARLVGIHVAQE